MGEHRDNAFVINTVGDELGFPLSTKTWREEDLWAFYGTAVRVRHLTDLVSRFGDGSCVV